MQRQSTSMGFQRMQVEGSVSIKRKTDWVKRYA